MWYIVNDTCSSTTSPPCWLVPLFQIFNYFHPACTPPSSKFIPAINDRYVSPILFVIFKTPQSNLLQTQPLQTCDNIWTSISRLPLEPPAVSRASTPGPPGTLVRGVGGYVLGWVGYPVVPPPLLFGQLPQALTCLCLFVCYWLTMESILFWENHFWTRPHMTQKRWGVICNKVEDSFSSEKEFSISWRHLPGFMWPMKRGKEGTLPDN